MPPPLDPDKRAAILADIETGDGCRAIARRHNVSPTAVSALAREEGIPDAFGRAQTKRANEARQVDMAAERSALAVRLMDRAWDLDERMDEQQTIVVMNRDGETSVERVDPAAKDLRDLMVALGIAVDKVAVLTRDDSQGVAAVDAWLHSLGVGQTTP